MTVHSSVELDHTIVHSRDRSESAHFLADILGLEVGPQSGPFLPVGTANGVTLDFADAPVEEIKEQHYAFLVSEEQFDVSFARLKEHGVTYYADPFRRRPGEINQGGGRRGVYFLDPSGHSMELLTGA